ncbi:hypothetical protein CDAR_74121 [Caerostris darwini]|uniref:Uncharacterized protein n=1 Tax=Caerostris darwini TaxID=1538125 RepID=A0AAV4Q987_9ARAC|nr:hypothetical protein CDAR_74121 [Caerostris darwini]
MPFAAEEIINKKPEKRNKMASPPAIFNSAQITRCQPGKTVMTRHLQQSGFQRRSFDASVMVKILKKFFLFSRITRCQKKCHVLNSIQKLPSLSLQISDLNVLANG